MPAGYSKTLLSKKLGIKIGSRVALLNPIDHITSLLDPLPNQVSLLYRPRSRVDVIIAFCQHANRLESLIQRAIGLMNADSGCWLSWPKKTSKLRSDLDFNRVQKTGLNYKLVDNKVCAIDEDWSGLRFVVRKTDRAKWP